jgi:hypothetical protein
MMDFSTTLVDTEFTWSYSKLSCWKGAYFAHVIFCYFVFLSGIACFVTRCWDRIKWTHLWFGRIYILSMLWATATSILIHNTGLPLAVLWSFLWVMGGMTIGWVVINLYQQHMQVRGWVGRKEKGRLAQYNSYNQMLRLGVAVMCSCSFM